MAINNSLAPKKQTFSAFLTQDAVKKRINDVIGGKNGQRFITAITSAISANPGLAECDHSTILSSALLGEALNLSPSPQLGQYYLVPFNDKKRGQKVAQFQLGYKGYIQLAIRSGQYKKLNVLAIKKGELIKYDPLNEEIEVRLIENDIERENTETIGYYAMFEYLNGFRKTIYWSKDKMESHAIQYSQGYASDKRNNTSWTFWSKDFDGMAYKTMLRQLISKWGIMSIEMQKGYEADMSEVKENGTFEYIDNEKNYNENVIETETEIETEKISKDILENNSLL